MERELEALAEAGSLDGMDKNVAKPPLPGAWGGVAGGVPASNKLNPG